MLRYRIACHENGRYFVLPAFLEVVPISETYASRAAAQETADWLNRLAAPEKGSGAFSEKAATSPA